MTAPLTELFVQATACAGLVSVGALAIFLLPWRDDELAETTAAVRDGWRWLDRALRTDDAPEPVLTSASPAWQAPATAASSSSRAA